MEWKITNLYVYEIQKYLAPLWHLVGICMTIMCHNDELSSTMSWVGCLLKVSELFILFAENSQTLLKISVIPILFI